MKLLPLIFILISCAHLQKSPSETIKEVRNEYHLAAVAAGVSVNQEMLFLEVQGLRKINSPIQATKEDVFHLGSCTKAMTATLVAKIIEEGHFDWDSKLSELLKGEKLDKNFRNITVSQLLTHEAGLIANPERSFSKEMSRLNVMKARRIIAQKILSKAPTHPQNEYHYSNTGYIILAHLLERKTGKGWEELMREKLFIPLEMKSCGFGITSPENEMHPSQPWGHQVVKNKLRPIQSDNYPFFGPSGSVHCNLVDWNKFLVIQIQGFHHESDFLKPAQFTKLFSTSSPQSTYTFGGWVKLERTWAGGVVFTHSGSNTLNYSTAWLAPIKRAAIMSVTNTSGSHEALDELNSYIIKKYIK